MTRDQKMVEYMKKHGFTKFIAACFIALPLLVTVLVVYHDAFTLYFRLAEATIFVPSPNVDTNFSSDDPIDKLLGGLLTVGFDEKSCLSRYQSAFYRKDSPHKPSPYLISRLRSYEELHRKCGPHTDSYNQAVAQLKSGHDPTRDKSPAECSYIVWIAFSGLGNRMITMASAFLYALLTHRVLLVHQGADMADLFCEPFPNTSWILPEDFPVSTKFRGFNKHSPESHGNLMKKNLINNSSAHSFVYIHLAWNSEEQDRRFYCDQEQAHLAKVPWLLMRCDVYFVPALFLNPSFQEELAELFPDKETVFHHLGRYLLHPSNKAWGQITRSYKSYLSRADDRLGIQIRTMGQGHGPFQYMKDRILACTHQHKLLPELNEASTLTPLPSENQKLKAVLITSLSSGYSDILSNRFRAYPTVTGEGVAVYQPSHEEEQRFGDGDHNMKALTEMYLLSLSDELVTSSWSTFGYVAQSLGGMKPWIMSKKENLTESEPPCWKDISMEPCFHSPPLRHCDGTLRDFGTVVPHVKHCTDIKGGLKLVNSPQR